MEELLMCSVCIERYCEKEKHPVVLPRCGHSFCRSCVSMLVSGGCVVCPTCRTDQRIEKVDKLPTEYTLLAIIEAQECSKKETCERHSVKLSFWCRTCSMSTCGECLFEDHPTHSHEVIRASKYITDMKLNAQDVANKFMEVLDEREKIFFREIFENAKKISSALCSIGVLRKDMEEARELMKGIKEEESITEATALSEASKFLGLKWNIQDANYARKLKEENERKQRAIEEKEAETQREKDEEVKIAKLRTDEEETERQARKAARRLLRKSRTMSSVEMTREAEKVRALNKETINGEESVKVKPAEIVEMTEDQTKPSKDPPPVVEATKKESETESVRDKPNEKVEKSIHDSEYRGDKIPDLVTVKPKGKYILKKQLSIKKPEPVENTFKKLPTHELLPVIPENDVEKLEGATVSDLNSDTTIIPEKAKTDDIKISADVTSEDPTINEEKAEALISQEPKVDEVKSEEIKIEDIKPDENGDDQICNEEKQEHKETNGLDIVEQSSVVDPLEETLKLDGKLTDYIQVPGFMIAVESSDGRLAEMAWGPQGLHVHCLQYNHVSYDIVIKTSVLNLMISSKNPTIFLELSADKTILGRVYIKLYGYLKRAHNFLALCLGEDGKSFLNTKFLQVYNVNESGERILGGDYEHNNGRGGRGLLSDLEWNGDYAMPMEAGMVTAAGSGQDATNSLFLLCTQSDSKRNFSCPFGSVCEGLKVVKDAVQSTATKEVWITDCGVIIQPPKYNYG